MGAMLLYVLQCQTVKTDPAFKTAEIIGFITFSKLGFVHTCCLV